MLTYWLYKIGSIVIPRVPKRVSFLVAVTIADLVYFVWATKRRVTLDNFAHIFKTSPKDKRVRLTAKKAFRNYAKYIIELLRLPKMSEEEVMEEVSFEGLEHLEQVMADDKGVIFVSAHFGNIDVAGVALAPRSRPIHVVADASSRRLYELLTRLRRQRGLSLIPLENVRAILRALKRREVITLLVDWGAREDGVATSLFGEATTLPAGPATLALRTGATLLPGYIRRRPDNRFSLTLEAPIVPERTGNLKKDVQNLTERLARTLESFIAHYPDQWYIFRPMWPSPVYSGENRGATESPA